MRAAAPRCARREAPGRASPRCRALVALPTSASASGDAFLHGRDPQRGAGGQRELGGLGEVEGVRTHHHRAAAGRRLDQVLAAERREAAAEQGDVGERVAGRHLAHRVAEPDVGRGRVRGRRVAQALRRDEAEAGLADQRRRRRRSAADGAARREQRPRRGHGAPGREQARFLAFARHRREHHRRAPSVAFQRRPRSISAGFGREVELEVAGDDDLARAGVAQPRGVGLGLGEGRGQALERPGAAGHRPAGRGAGCAR